MTLIAVYSIVICLKLQLIINISSLDIFFTDVLLIFFLQSQNQNVTMERAVSMQSATRLAAICNVAARKDTKETHTPPAGS